MPFPLLFGPYGRNALNHIDRFSAIGANAAWFHMFDAEAFAACERYGVAPCVEFKTFRADFKERPELVPTGVDGRPIRYGRLVQGVCLSQEDFLAETEAHLVEGVRQFQPVGVWLDYLTYAGWFEMPDPDLQESCFCAACIADFVRLPALMQRHRRRSWRNTRRNGQSTSVNVSPALAHTMRRSSAAIYRIVLSALICVPGRRRSSMAR
jgi:hypothetical protein